MLRETRKNYLLDLMQLNKGLVFIWGSYFPAKITLSGQEAVWITSLLPTYFDARSEDFWFCPQIYALACKFIDLPTDLCPCLQFFATCLKIYATCPQIYATCLQIFATCPQIYATCLKIFATCPQIYAACLQIFATCPQIYAACLQIFATCPQIYATCPQIYATCLKIYAIYLQIFAIDLEIWRSCPVKPTFYLLNNAC